MMRSDTCVQSELLRGYRQIPLCFGTFNGLRDATGRQLNSVLSQSISAGVVRCGVAKLHIGKSRQFLDDLIHKLRPVVTLNNQWKTNQTEDLEKGSRH